jgi:hypothetical protein
MDAALVDLVRHGKITRKLAESRSSTPEELKRLMGSEGELDQPTISIGGPKVSLGGPGAGA